MANAVKVNTILQNSGFVILYVTLTSDGSNETNTVIYDSSVVSAAVRPVQLDPLHCWLMSISGISNAADTARIKLVFDATTKVLAHVLPATGKFFHACYEEIGGLPDYADGGITGDILLTTTGLASGDTLNFVLKVKPQ